MKHKFIWGGDDVIIGDSGDGDVDALEHSLEFAAYHLPGQHEQQSHAGDDSKEQQSADEFYKTAIRRGPGISGLDERAKLEALPDSTPIWTFHATDKKTAEDFLNNGIDTSQKPMNLARWRLESGSKDPIEFAPGRGLAAGLTVGSSPQDVSGYGRVILAIRTTKGQLQPSPEAIDLGYNTGIAAFEINDAQLPGKIPSSAIYKIGSPGQYPGSAYEEIYKLRLKKFASAFKPTVDALNHSWEFAAYYQLAKPFFSSLPSTRLALDLTPGSTGLRLFDEYKRVRGYHLPGEHEQQSHAGGGQLPKEIDTAPGVKDRKGLADWRAHNGRNWGGMQRSSRFVMDYKNVVPVDSPTDLATVYGAWKELSKDNPLGYVAFDAVIKQTGLSSATIFGVVKQWAVAGHPTESNIAFSVDRMGDGTEFRFKKPPVVKFDAYQPHDDDPGVMVAIKVPAAVAEQLAVPSGNKPDDLHCTLAYLGRLSTIKDRLPAVRQALADVAADYAPMTGRINGLGRFGASEASDDKEVIYAALDCPGLAALRTELVKAIEVTGVEVAKEHDFAPHITLSYVEPGEELGVPLPDYEMTVGYVALIWGDDGESWPLAAKVYHLPGQHEQERHGDWTEGKGKQPAKPPQFESPDTKFSRDAFIHAGTGVSPQAVEAARDYLEEKLGRQFLVEDGIDVTFDSEAKLHVLQLANVPEHILDQFKASGGTVVIGKGGFPDVDAQDAVKGQQPRGWPEGQTWDHVPGGYSPRDNMVAIGVGDKDSYWHGTSSLVLHELGHAVDRLYYSKGSIDSMANFFPIALKYKKDLDPYTAIPEEFYAETFSNMLSSSSNRKQWARKYPDAVAYMEKRLNI